MAQFAVIVPAAGQSSRFGGPEKKPFLSIRDQPIWMWSMQAFAHRTDVVQKLLAIAPADIEQFLKRFKKEIEAEEIEVIAGGVTRTDSVRNALAAVRPQVDYVAIHDAARPCVQLAEVDAVFLAAEQRGAAILAVPAADTIKRVDSESRIKETVPRTGLWLAQTPQVFRRDWITSAFERQTEPGQEFTDDAQMVEAASRVVHIVPGARTNLKITKAEDLLLAEAILASRN